MKARDERKDTIALLFGATTVGGFLVGSLLSWPAGFVTLAVGTLALGYSLRQP